MNTVLTLAAMIAIMVAPFTLGAALSAITGNPGARNGFANYNWTDAGDSRDLHRATHDLEAVRARFS